MTETRTEKLRRSAALAFMALVTSCLLALALSQSERGAAGLPSVVVYAFAAGFGLEFVGSAWSGARGQPDGARR